jgi:hypothetical protein
MFCTTTSEKWRVGDRVIKEAPPAPPGAYPRLTTHATLALTLRSRLVRKVTQLAPNPPSINIFDAGLGGPPSLRAAPPATPLPPPPVRLPPRTHAPTYIWHTWGDLTTTAASDAAVLTRVLRGAHGQVRACCRGRVNILLPIVGSMATLYECGHTPTPLLPLSEPPTARASHMRAGGIWAPQHI